jgi:ABC-type multidrug transport system fused ATPase/permease subunit
MSSANQNVHEFYQQRFDAYGERLEAINRQSSKLTWSRVGTFVLAAVFASFAWANPALFWLWIAAAVGLLAGFVLLVKKHEKLLWEAGEVRLRQARNRIQLARLDRRWEEIPEVPMEVSPQHRAVARDLDLVGKTSVFQLISSAHTPIGRATLLDWLLQGALPQEINFRQQAVRALVPESDLREEFDLRGRQLGADQAGPVEFVRWAEGPTWLTQRGWLLWLARGLAAATLVTFVAGLVTGALVAWLLLAVVLIVNLLVNVLFASQALMIFDQVSSRNHSIQHYRALFEAIAELDIDSPFLKRLQSKLGSTPHEPIQHLDRLMRIIGLANLRRDSAFGIIYLLGQLLFLVDFHILARLEQWQQQHGSVVRNWLSAVGQLEAISSLATLAHDHPDWTLPTVERSADKTIQARGIGHPMLPDGVCVRNDVTVGPTGTFLLVTGSNMSGKSTLLRSLGVNVALAQAGGPVCAESFSLPPLILATSMRIDDSLADGVSFFMAELKRLKQIVDHCLELESSPDWTLFYLLDEILQGTNSAERHIAVSQVIGHLVKHGAVGAVSTHDLELAASPSIVDSCQTVHFRETIAGNGPAQQMTFDHKMRPGVTPTTNALKLLELVGLGDFEE